MSHDLLVDIQNLSFHFPKTASASLKNIQAQIPKGEIVGLVGPDGAGKTTLMRLIAALLVPTSGSITVAGSDTVYDAEEIHAIIGYMPQRFGLYEDLSVIQNLNLYADLRSVVGQEKESVFKKLLNFTGLEPFQNRLARNLSGGMKQKLGLACALVKTPTLLLLDEPSVGVDPLSRRELWKMVHDLLQEGISVIWSTAYLDEAQKCHTVLLLNEGELLFFGNPLKLTERVKGRVFLRPQTEGRKTLQHLLNEPDVLDGVIQGKQIRVVYKEKGAHQGLATKPRFEDAFMDILGGGPGGRSLLAESRAQLKKNKNDVVSADALTKKFDSFTAVDHVTLKVRAGEVFGLLGPNGAGKSTIFKMLCGLLRPTSGTASIEGFDLQQSPIQARSHIGYMAQKFSLYGNLSVLQNLNFFSGIYNLKKQRQKEAVEKMVEIFDLQPYLNVSSELLPLGFKQRLSLACATMHNPTILFLDEPTSGVDPITRREFWNHINGLVEKGVTVMVTTHFMDEAEYCDRIALIYNGQIITMDTPDALKKHTHTSTLEEAFIALIESNKASK